jgi:hypothetical protein
MQQATLVRDELQTNMVLTRTWNRHAHTRIHALPSPKKRAGGVSQGGCVVETDPPRITIYLLGTRCLGVVTPTRPSR